MYVSKIEPVMTVPMSEGTVFVVQAPAGTERRIVLENLDVANTLTYKFQLSNDNSMWTDVAANATLAPGGRVGIVLSAATFYRLRASGNLSISVKVDAEVDIVSDIFTFIGS